MKKPTYSLKQAQADPKAMEQFIAEHEPLDAPKEQLKRYIDASAKPLDNRKASPSKSDAARFSDCK